jgi:hypothetical protein
MRPILRRQVDPAADYSDETKQIKTHGHKLHRMHGILVARRKCPPQKRHDQDERENHKEISGAKHRASSVDTLTSGRQPGKQVQLLIVHAVSSVFPSRPLRPLREASAFCYFSSSSRIGLISIIGVPLMASNDSTLIQ